jgi:hypothetical protein
VGADEQVLAGGRSNRGRVARRGAVVLRPGGEDRRVEQVLVAVTAVFDGAPRVLGRDEAGRLQLGWVPGEAVDRLSQPPASALGAVGGLGALLRRLHDATPAVARQLGALSSGLGDPSGEAEVVCHCDPTPGNVVFRGGRPVALIDWEYACPGRRAWDLAAALRFWAPLNAPANLPPGARELNRVDRARAILGGYDADPALRAQTLDLLPAHQQVTASNAARVMSSRGPQAYQAWVARGGLERLTRDRDWLHAHLGQLRTALL